MKIINVPFSPMSISPLELRHLRMLLAVRQTGSVSRAAELLHLTQSAVSHQIKLLEEFYGTPLFARKSVPLTFSPVGNRLLEMAEAVTAQVDHAQRDVQRLLSSDAGQLRIAVECHTCFDWLMPAMDTFRNHWPEIELDIVSGFHSDPVGLLYDDSADLAIVSELEPADELTHHALFEYEIMAIVANDHPLAQKQHLTARDFKGETLITYPIPEHMIDVVTKILKPAGIACERRSAELTIAILQLVASRKGIAALPRWAVQPYLQKNYVTALPITKNGLRSQLYAAMLKPFGEKSFAHDFIQVMRESSFISLPEVTLLPQPNKLLQPNKAARTKAHAA